jgi:DNA-binding transcriptional ArsR family regulator
MMAMKPAELLSSTHALLADRVRLTIMATLAATTEPIDFSALLDSLNLTKGNLSSHIQKLEEAGLIQVKKEFVGRKPRTTYLCSDLGRREVRNYLSKIERLLKQTRKDVKNV